MSLYREKYYNTFSIELEKQSVISRNFVLPAEGIYGSN